MKLFLSRDDQTTIWKHKTTNFEFDWPWHVATRHEEQEACLPTRVVGAMLRAWKSSTNACDAWSGQPKKKISVRDFLVRAGPGISNFFWSRLTIYEAFWNSDGINERKLFRSQMLITQYTHSKELLQSSPVTLIIQSKCYLSRRHLSEHVRYPTVGVLKVVDSLAHKMCLLCLWLHIRT